MQSKFEVVGRSRTKHADTDTWLFNSVLFAIVRKHASVTTQAVKVRLFTSPVPFGDDILIAAELIQRCLLFPLAGRRRVGGTGL